MSAKDAEKHEAEKFEEVIDQPVTGDSLEESGPQDHDAEMQAEESALDKAEEELVEQIRQAQEKAEENWELLLRTRAEMENLRRRTQKDLESAHKFGIEKFVTELLPIMDSMELGLAAEDASAEHLREGMELTVKMFEQMFEKFNIEKIDPVMEKFDPERHQAMTMQPSDEVEPNTVIDVMQKGYLLNERLVRPAMVVVSKASE